MDAHLIIKIIHMCMASLALLVFVLRAFTLYVGVQGNLPNPKGRKAFVAKQHAAYSLLALTGIILLIMNQFQVQPWFYAKVILFLVLLSTQIKTYKLDPEILLVQRRGGLVIGLIAFVAIIALVISKPTFG